uniref:Uncharacterized protein n=1 Tax=Ixodes ricinus TaxID=34613 RepID=A0A6B0TQW0_IXORI
MIRSKVPSTCLASSVSQSTNAATSPSRYRRKSASISRCTVSSTGTCCTWSTQTGSRATGRNRPIRIK